MANPKIEILWNRTVDEVLGNDRDGVTGVRLKSTAGEPDLEVDITGFFLAIGHTPNTAFLEGKLELTDEEVHPVDHAVPDLHQRGGRVRRRRRGRRLLPPGRHGRRQRLHGRPGRRALAGGRRRDVVRAAENVGGPRPVHAHSHADCVYSNVAHGKIPLPGRRPSVGRKCWSQGWVRTRRDSKAGFSFLELNDGSCFGNIQVVADGRAAELRSRRSSGSRPAAA